MDNKQHTTITEIALTDAELVAAASGEKPHDERWTVLNLYRRNDPGPYLNGHGPFIAEIVGETLVAGEQRRIRRAAFSSLAKALDWGAFSDSDLFREFRRKAIAWIEAQARDVAAGGSGSGLVPVRFMGGAGGHEQPLPAGQTKPGKGRRRYAKVEVELRFAGGREAIQEPHTIAVTWFNEDGSVGARTDGSFSRDYFGGKITAELPENSR